MSFKLALNAGHGLYTAGKRCMKSIDPNETREWTLNNRICDKIEAKLKEYEGYELIRLDDATGAKDVSLKTRTTKANEFKADFYLSIHHNAGINGGKGGGVVAYTYTTPTAVEKDWQSALYYAVVDRTGLRGNRSRPLSAKDLHECRESKMPCVLLECGFMDSTTDTPIILTETFAENVANACVEVLVKKANLKKKKKEETKPKVVYFPKYTGTSRSIIDGLKSVGAESSYTYRKSVAAVNSIAGYKGTSSQNTAMLKLLKQGKLIKT